MIDQGATVLPKLNMLYQEEITWLMNNAPNCTLCAFKQLKIAPEEPMAQ